MSAHIMAMTDDPDAPSGPTAPSPRSPHDILEEWRVAERALAEAQLGSAEAADALVRTRKLRAEYQRAYQDAQSESREGA